MVARVWPAPTRGGREQAMLLEDRPRPSRARPRVHTHPGTLSRAERLDKLAHDGQAKRSKSRQIRQRDTGKRVVPKNAPQPLPSLCCNPGRATPSLDGVRHEWREGGQFGEGNCDNVLQQREHRQCRDSAIDLG